jgi:hypothetical protein
MHSAERRKRGPPVSGGGTIAHKHLILGIETHENRMRKISYLWSDETWGFGAALGVVPWD